MLNLVAVPIGHPKDITLRALEVLKSAEVIVVEERAVGERTLKRLGVEFQELEQLNEHSQADDIQRLTFQCATKNAALITDAGTPGFCDPGALLVRSCREKKIEVRSIPGASSLMVVLSLSSVPLKTFYFAGFLPAENQERKAAIQKLKNHSGALVLMDTPYRLGKLIGEMSEAFAHRKMLLALNLTEADELQIEGSASYINEKLTSSGIKKAEFMLLIYPHL